MAVKRILLLGNPILRAKCKKVTHFSSPATRSTIRNLEDTLDDFRLRMGFGRGVAAPQIGSKLRIIFINPGGLGPLLNPVITKRSSGRFSLWDDCFSFPDILVKVRRYTWVEVSYQDEFGRKKRLRAKDALSELLQHEIDHLDGILAFDRANSSRHIVLRSERRKIRRSFYGVNLRG